MEDYKHPLAGHTQLPGTNKGTWPMPNTAPTVFTHRSDWYPYGLPCIALGTTMQGKHFPNYTFVGCEGLPTAAPTLDAPTLDAPYRRSLSMNIVSPRSARI